MRDCLASLYVAVQANRCCAGLMVILLPLLLLQSCGSSRSAQKAEAPADYPDYHIPEEATKVSAELEPFTPKWYIERYKVYAVKEMKRTGIPASITLAQGMLESSYGKSRLAKKGNNHFGIKCHRGNWGGGEMYLADDRPNECFRTYQSVLHSFQDHSRFLKTGNRYQELFELQPNNYKAWAEGLKDAGYATNPRYHKILIKLIRTHNLHHFDQFYNKPFQKGRQLANQKADTEAGEQQQQKVNGLKAYQPQGEEDLHQIAEQTGVAVDKLRQYNDFHDPYATVVPNTPLYLEQKKDKPAKAYHVVEKGESLWNIAQQYGVKLRNLCKRNRLNAPEQPPVGKRVFLRKVRYSQMPERQEPLPEPEQAPEAQQAVSQPPEQLPRYHAVEAGQTMREIARRYGIALDRLYKMNRLNRGQQPAAGAEIHLKETRYVKPAVRNKPVRERQASDNQQEDPDSEAEQNTPKTPAKASDEDREAPKPMASVPDTAKTAEPLPRAETGTTGDTGAPQKATATHTVKAGQTLYQIASQHGIALEKLRRWNNLSSNVIQAGQELLVAKPEPADTPASQSADTATRLPAHHIVKKGETLFGIAQQYDLSVKTLKARNNLSANNLAEGQRLRIRPPSSSQPQSAKAEKNGQTHRVKANETLFGIAQQYGVAVKALRQANDLPDSQIRKGQKLVVPE